MKDIKKESEIIDEDSYSYSADTELTPRQIILRHIDRMSKYIFKGEQEPTITEKVITTDRRQIIIQAVEFLSALLDDNYDEEMKQKQEKFDEQMITIEKDLIISSIAEKSLEKTKNQTGNSQSNYVKNINFYRGSKIIPINKASGNFEAYMNKKFNLYMNLFKKQINLLNRKDWLSTETYTEKFKE